MVKQDLEDFNIPTSFDFIKSKSKGVFKKLVKEKARDYALRKLKNIQLKHSKMKKLQYEDIQVQDYFTRCDINTEQKKLIFKYRTRMAEFGENFRGGGQRTGFLPPVQKSLRQARVKL